MGQLKPTVLFDIDGTIANIKHRRKFLEQTSPDWKSFNASMGQDIPNEDVVSLYKSLWSKDDFEITLVTGRSDRHRKITEQWLSWNEIPYNQILMRSDKDFRADSLIKQDILNNLLNAGKIIAFVVDDRQQVVDMWRRNGITCLQCDVGDF